MGFSRKVWEWPPRIRSMPEVDLASWMSLTPVVPSRPMWVRAMMQLQPSERRRLVVCWAVFMGSLYCTPLQFEGETRPFSSTPMPKTPIFRPARWNIL